MFGISLLNIYIFEISESNDRNTFQTSANLSKFKLWLLIYRNLSNRPRFKICTRNLFRYLSQVCVRLSGIKYKFEIEETRHNFLLGSILAFFSKKVTPLQVIKFNNLLTTIVKFFAVNNFPTSIIIKQKTITRSSRCRGRETVGTNGWDESSAATIASKVYRYVTMKVGGKKKRGEVVDDSTGFTSPLIVFRLMDGFRCKMLIDAIKTSRTAFPACDSPRYSRHTAIVAPQMRKGRGSFYSPFKASNNGPSSKGLIQNNFITIMRQFSFYRIFHGFLRFHGKG